MRVDTWPNITVLTSCTREVTFIDLLDFWLSQLRAVSAVHVTVATFELGRSLLHSTASKFGRTTLEFHSRANGMSYMQWRLRVLVRTLSRFGHVIACDLDAVWYRNPVHWLVSHDFDVVASPGLSPPQALKAFNGFTVCMGFASFSQAALGFLQAVLARPAQGDQAPTNVELLSLDPSWRPLSFPYLSNTTVRAQGAPLRLAVLSPDFACRDTCLHVASTDPGVHVMHPWGREGYPKDLGNASKLTALAWLTALLRNRTTRTTLQPLPQRLRQHGHSQYGHNFNQPRS